MFLFMPIIMFIIWVAVIGIITTVMKNVISSGARQSHPQSRRPAPTIQTSSAPKRPQSDNPFEGTFLGSLMEVPQEKPAKEKKATVSHKSFHNSDFDSYESHRAKGRGKDYTTGYNKDFSKGGSDYRRSKAMQYSHTYDGHEPWDDCLPKEKDPWDKDFYVE